MDKLKEQLKTIKKAIIVYGILIIVCFTGFVNNNMNIREMKSENDKLKNEIIELNDSINSLHLKDSIQEFISFLNIKHPDVVMKQFIIESGGFNSKLFKTHNNVAGMRMPFKRPNTALKDSNGYAYYDNWQMSVIDYAMYQIWSGKNLNKNQYIDMLHNNYAEDSTYKYKFK